MEGMTNALKVGATVVVALIAFLAAYFVITEQVVSIGQTYYVFVHFDNALGIKEGMPVKLAGKDVGQVEWIQLAIDDNQVSFAEVKLRIREDVQLKTKDRVIITQDGFFGEKFLAISQTTSEISDIVAQGDTLQGGQEGGFTELIAEATAIMDKMGELLSDEALGGLAESLDATLEKVDGMITDMQGLVADNSSYITASMRNIHGVTSNFLEISKDLEETGQAVKKLAADPEHMETLAVISANLKEASETVNHMLGQIDQVVSDPALQQDAKDSVRLTKETLAEAKATMRRFQVTMNKVDGLLGSGEELMDEASGAITEAKSKMQMIDQVGGSIDVQTRLNLRAVDVDDDQNLDNDDIYTADMNVAVGYGNNYISVGADNIGEETDGNFLLGYGSLGGFSFRGGIYRGELGLGGAWYTPRGGGAELMWYDTEDPKWNAYGYVPVGDHVNVVVGVEDIENNAQPSVGVGVEF